jgi:diguanylate cyclase (GGDEF)-like protein
VEILGIVALIAFPAWSGFDFLLLPSRAASFVRVRLVFEVAIALAWFALRWHRMGGRWPQQTAFVLVALPEVAIAWMIPRSSPHLEAYLLGFSLAIYASAHVCVWHWRLTLLLVGLTGVATAMFSVFTRPQPDVTQIAIIVFYLGTAGALATVGQLYRYREGWRQFRTQAALDSAHRRNQALVAELGRLSREDTLTTVGNRRAWQECLADEASRAHRLGSPLSIIFCDFDHFKRINDENGHAVGDEVLRAGAAILMSRIRATDYVARLGGDEFAVACPDTPLAAAVRIAGDIADLARATRWPAGVTMTFSLGVAELHPDERGTADLLDRADIALYKAKTARNGVGVQRHALQQRSQIGSGAPLHRPARRPVDPECS